MNRTNSSETGIFTPTRRLVLRTPQLSDICSSMRRLFSHPASCGTTGCLFVRKITSCMFDSIADGSGYFFRIRRIRSDYLRFVFHNPGIFYSGNKILKEPALSCLLNVNLYGSNACSSLRVSVKTSKIMQLC